MLRFLYDLIELYDKYEAEERLRLANALRSDILYWAELIGKLYKIERENIAEELGKRFTYWSKVHFLHLDITAREYDDARDYFRMIVKSYDQVLDSLGIKHKKNRFEDANVEQILAYCRAEGLDLLITALSGMIATDDTRAEKFRRVTSYSNLKSILTGFEYFLKRITEGHVSLPSGTSATLWQVIKETMKNENWFPRCSTRVKKKRTSGANLKEFFSNLSNLLNSKQLQGSETAYWARVFLLTCLARNLTVHTYPLDDWFYGEAFGEMAHAVMYAILYTWQMAQKQGWV